jgi:hypothetical protein
LKSSDGSLLPRRAILDDSGRVLGCRVLWRAYVGADLALTPRRVKKKQSDDRRLIAHQRQRRRPWTSVHRGGTRRCCLHAALDACITALHRKEGGAASCLHSLLTESEGWAHRVTPVNSISALELLHDAMIRAIYENRMVEKCTDAVCFGAQGPTATPDVGPPPPHLQQETGGGCQNGVASNGCQPQQQDGPLSHMDANRGMKKSFAV